MAYPAVTSDLRVKKACPTLTSDHVGTNPIIISERPSTYIWSTHDWRRASTSLFYQHMIEDRYYTYILSTHDKRKELHLHLINTWSKKGTTLIFDQHMIEERICTYIWSTDDQRKALHLHSSKLEHILPQWWKVLHSYLIMREHIPAIISEWPTVLDWATW